MRIRNNVQVYVLNKNDNELLILKRVPSKSGYWQPVCGGIERRETLYNAGLRELKEETSLEKNKEDLIELPFEFSYIEEKNKEQMSMVDKCLLIIINKREEVDISEEHEAYKWVRLEDISDYVQWEPILKVSKHIALEYCNRT